MKTMLTPRHSVLAVLLAAFTQLSILSPQPASAQVAPSITVQPTNQYVSAGSVVSFSVTATGAAPLQYQWQKDGTNLADGANLTGTTAATLSLSNVQTSQMGFYSVSVTNAYGSITSTVAVLRLVPLAAWGRNDYGETTIPNGLSNVVALAVGGLHSLALTADGRVVGWGDDFFGQTTIPSGLSNVVTLAAGWYHSLALTTEGRVVGWGNNSVGQTTIPSGLSSVVALAAGGSHSLALLRLPLSLAVTRQGTHLVLQWTRGYGPCQVQQTASLGASKSWENVGGLVQTNSMSLPICPGNLFLRVRRP
ncbi:MAG: immunoglobulin domain-containing protein [Verrucomicrobia bacterium]|nr:immunoglobulin domain-containing protein [Verrucomicrobiota bacterium]